MSAPSPSIPSTPFSLACSRATYRYTSTIDFFLFIFFTYRYDHNGTFTLTTQFGASASVTFNGTAVWIYGARRGNHAPYNTTLDGKTFFDDGYSSVDEFQQVLFSGAGLGGGSHAVTIVDSVVDAGRPYLDVDSVCMNGLWTVVVLFHRADFFRFVFWVG